MKMTPADQKIYTLELIDQIDHNEQLNPSVRDLRDCVKIGDLQHAMTLLNSFDCDVRLLLACSERVRKEIKAMQEAAQQ